MPNSSFSLFCAEDFPEDIFKTQVTVAEVMELTVKMKSNNLLEAGNVYSEFPKTPRDEVAELLISNLLFKTALLKTGGWQTQHQLKK